MASVLTVTVYVVEVLSVLSHRDGERVHKRLPSLTPGKVSFPERESPIHSGLIKHTKAGPAQELKATHTTPATHLPNQS